MHNCREFHCSKITKVRHSKTDTENFSGKFRVENIDIKEEMIQSNNSNRIGDHDLFGRFCLLLNVLCNSSSCGDEPFGHFFVANKVKSIHHKVDDQGKHFSFHFHNCKI